MIESGGVLLDTSFMIRFLNAEDPLHRNTRGFYRYFIDNGFQLFYSTISVAEYCVKGDYQELPLRQLRLLPFNFQHGIKAGLYAKILLKDKKEVDVSRTVITNDVKLFAQASLEKNIFYFATSDESCLKEVAYLKGKNQKLEFEVLNIRRNFGEVFSILGFEL